MTLKQIASLGKELVKFLALFVAHFRSRPGFVLLQIYVQGLLSDLQRKNVEAIALYVVFRTKPQIALELIDLTVEQVRRAMNTWLETARGQLTRVAQYQRELVKQQYYQRRNAHARRSHTKTRKALLHSLGIDADRIKTCIPRSPT